MVKQLIFKLMMAALLIPFAAQADWLLDEQASAIGFVSIKNGAVVESHHFKTLSGIISEDGQARVIIDLDSVETLIPIRNERMRSLLFKTTEYSEAFVSVDLAMGKFNTLATGSSMMESLEVDVTISGVTASVTVPVTVTRSADSVIVSSIKPAVISAGNWGLMPGIEALRAIAGLTSITPTVPVSFTLKFDHGIALSQ
ncbi:MAG: polyisoprenoid-binding protein YceI [Candidatus Azotimanducaceae bacterium]|jgi:polyisoprenoid-binding protein YceI